MSLAICSLPNNSVTVAAAQAAQLLNMFSHRFVAHATAFQPVFPSHFIGVYRAAPLSAFRLLRAESQIVFVELLQDFHLLDREIPLSQGFSVAGSKFMALRATNQAPLPPSRTVTHLLTRIYQIIVGKCGLQVTCCSRRRFLVVFVAQNRVVSLA
jgi:hypothetical protein